MRETSKISCIGAVEKGYFGVTSFIDCGRVCLIVPAYRGRVAARFHHHLTVRPSRASMEVKENDRHIHHLSGCRESNLPGLQGVDVAGQGAHWPLDSVLALISATAFVAHAHRNQRRKDADPTRRLRRLRAPRRAFDVAGGCFGRLLSPDEAIRGAGLASGKRRATRRRTTRTCRAG